jgi:hypothetical protein
MSTTSRTHLGTDLFPSQLGVMMTVIADHPFVSLIRKEAYRVAKAEWGCHYCADAITTLIRQNGPNGPFLFHHFPDYSDITTRLSALARQLYAWACDDPSRRFTPQIITEQRLRWNTHYGPLAANAIHARIATYEANIDNAYRNMGINRPTVGDRVRILAKNAHFPVGTCGVVTIDTGGDFPYYVSAPRHGNSGPLRSADGFSVAMLEKMDTLDDIKNVADIVRDMRTKIEKEQIKMAQRNTASERFCHYINNAEPALPDGIRDKDHTIQMCDAAFSQCFGKAYNFFEKFTNDWGICPHHGISPGHERVRQVHNAIRAVTGGTKAFDSTMQNLDTTLAKLAGRSFAAHPVTDRIKIILDFIVRSKKTLNGNGNNGVECIDCTQTNGAISRMCEKATSPRALTRMIEEFVDPLKRGRRDPTKVLSTGQIASAEKALGNFTTRCASLESLQACYKHTDRKSIWVKPNRIQAAAGGGTFAALRAETAARIQQRYAPHWSSYPSTLNITSVEGLLDAVEAGEKIEILVDRNHEMANVCHIDNVADPDMWSCRPDGTPLGWSFCLKSFPPNFPTQGSWVEVIGGHRIETGTAPHNFILVLKDVCHDMLKWCCGMPRIGEWCLSGQAKRHHGPAVEKIAHSSSPATRMRPCGSGETPLIGIGLCLDDTTLNKGGIQKGGITFRIRTGSEAASVKPHAGYKQGEINLFNKPSLAKTSHSSAAYTRTCWTCVCCEVSNPTTSRFCSFCGSAQ